MFGRSGTNTFKNLGAQRRIPAVSTALLVAGFGWMIGCGDSGGLDDPRVECTAEEVLLRDQCVPRCAPEEIRNNAGVCTPCAEGTIAQDGVCIPCAEGTVAENGICVSAPPTCPDGEVNVEGSCIHPACMNPELDQGNGLAGSPYILCTRADLEAIGPHPGVFYQLGTDIDLSDARWTPLPEFKGTLLGAGHTISGLRISEQSGIANAEVGLFSFVGESGYIENLRIHNARVQGAFRYALVGVLAGHFNGTTLNITIENSDVSGTFLIGGVAGSMVNAHSTGNKVLHTKL